MQIVDSSENTDTLVAWLDAATMTIFLFVTNAGTVWSALKNVYDALFSVIEL